MVLTVASQDGKPGKASLQKCLIIIDIPEESTAATRRMVSNWTSAPIQHGHPSGNGKEVLKDMQMDATQTMKHKTELLETIGGNMLATTANITQSYKAEGMQAIAASPYASHTPSSHLLPFLWSSELTSSSHNNTLLIKLKYFVNQCPFIVITIAIGRR